MEPLLLDSEIPASHPEKQAIEEAIRKALAGLSGWKVQVAVARRAAWWVIRIQGPHFRRALVVVHRARPKGGRGELQEMFVRVPST